MGSYQPLSSLSYQPKSSFFVALVTVLVVVVVVIFIAQIRHFDVGAALVAAPF